MPPPPSQAAAPTPFQVWTFRIALGALLVLALARWPVSLSFSDEVGYLGQARLILSGHISPTASDPGVFERLDGGGLVSRYPLFVPFVVAPLTAIHPRLAFLLGMASLVVVLWIAARIFDGWRLPRALALLFAVHPTFIILGFTAMADLFLVAASLAAFALGERGRRLAALPFALVVLAKPVGVLIAAGLVCGGAVSRWREERAIRPALRASVWPLGGIAAGGVAAAALNWLSWRHFGYSYDALHSHLGVPVFSFAYLRQTLPIYLPSLVVLLPGLLILGPLGLWRRRSFGPLFVTIGLIGLMACYFFFDHGRSRAETMVLAQRLILPATAFMILGYADILAVLIRRASAARFLSVLLVVASVVEIYAISTRLRGWQRDARDAVTAASAELARRGASELGTTEAAMKAALLYRGPVALVGSALHEPPVVICNVASGSYRAPSANSCALPGYEAVGAYGTFRVLGAR